MNDDFDSTSTGTATSPAAFIAEYGNLLSLYGPDSVPAERFLEAHRDRPEFSALAETAARMKESARRLKATVEHQDQIVRDRFTDRHSLERQIRRFAYLAAFLVVLGVGLLYRAETLKNKELVNLLNKGIAPFAYYKIPEIEKDNQTSLSTYDAVRKLAKLRNPTDYPEEWGLPLLYVWARSALVDWQDSDYANETLLREVERRINYIRGLDPEYARIDALQAQVEIGKAMHARKTGDKAAERAAYEAAVRFNEAALAKDKEAKDKKDKKADAHDPDGRKYRVRVADPSCGLLARNNLADALDRLGQAAPQAEKLGYFERARDEAEQAVALAKPLFLRGQEASFATYLDTLGDIYQHLYQQYAALPTPSEREEKQKRWLCDARAIYQAIAWNYEGISFENWNPATVQAYRDTKRDNLARLKNLEDLARRLGVTCAPEAPRTRASGAK